MNGSLELANYLDGKIAVVTGDITAETSDAIVNAANKSLLGGGGVDGVIHRTGGPAITDECRALRSTLYPDGLPTGEVVITTAGSLPAKHVIHTVGPVYGSEAGSEDALLKACYRNCIRLAEAHELKSISFPSISTGAFGFPKPRAAVLSTEAVAAELETSVFVVSVRLVFFSEADAEVFISNSGF